MKIHQLTVDEALKSLRSSPEGLSTLEARRRLVEFGPNRVEKIRATPLILLIDYTPWRNLIFGTVPIPVNIWMFVIPFAVGMLALEELRKWLARRFF